MKTMSAVLGVAAFLLGACATLSRPAADQVCADCVRQTMEMLAGPELKGRGCGTEDEHEAARRLAVLFDEAGLKGAAADGGFLQEAPFTPRGQTQARRTYNVIGTIPGRSPEAGAILISAHYDHLGVRNGVIYPGANDDASGSAAVVELARILSQGRAPRRTLQFALFGCEEQGGFGARQYTTAPPTPLNQIVANLQFEMIGQPDPQRPDKLMLTGWERSNLGPALAEQGAAIGPDLYPEQNFFRRSDNYQLALRGVVAQTISAWPLPPTYHQPTDTIENLDMVFMTGVIGSLVEPIRWLSNSEFKPDWNPGMKPEPAPAAASAR